MVVVAIAVAPPQPAQGVIEHIAGDLSSEPLPLFAGSPEVNAGVDPCIHNGLQRILDACVALGDGSVVWI